MNVPQLPAQPNPEVPIRRVFLQQTAAASVAMSLAVPQAEAAEESKPNPAESILPTIALGPHRITRLMLGGNPIYGHSHFNRLLNTNIKPADAVIVGMYQQLRDQAGENAATVRELLNRHAGA